MKTFIAALVAGCALLSGAAFGQSSDATFNNNMQLNTGNSTAVNGTGNTQAITFQGSSPPPVGMIAIPNNQAPAVFQYIPNNFGMPAEITGMALEVFYEQKCRPEESDQGESEAMSRTGGSSLTLITITTHPDLNGLRRGDKKAKVNMDLSGEKKHYRCLGIMTVMASKDALEKGQPVGFSAIASDMRRAARAEFYGVKGEITLLSRASYWGGAVGVTSGSSGISFGLSLVRILSSVASMGVAPGFSGGTGASSPSSRSGLTALILVEVPADDPKGIDIGLADVKNPFGENAIDPVGSNGKKAEADKH